jgi:hypothetical protein
MSKKITALILALITVLTLASCAKEEGVPDGYKKISDDNIGYSLFVPELWEESGPSGAIAGAGDTSKVSLMGFDAGEAMNTEEVWNTHYESLKEAFGEINLISEGKDTYLGKNPAKEYIYTANIAGKEYKFLQIIYFTRNETLISSQPEAYIFTFTATTENFEKHYESDDGEVSEIIGYVTFENDK